MNKKHRLVIFDFQVKSEIKNMVTDETLKKSAKFAGVCICVYIPRQHGTTAQ